MPEPVTVALNTEGAIAIGCGEGRAVSALLCGCEQELRIVSPESIEFTYLFRQNPPGGHTTTHYGRLTIAPFSMPVYGESTATKKFRCDGQPVPCVGWSAQDINGEPHRLQVHHEVREVWALCAWDGFGNPPNELLELDGIRIFVHSRSEINPGQWVDDGQFFTLNMQRPEPTWPGGAGGTTPLLGELPSTLSSLIRSYPYQGQDDAVAEVFISNSSESPLWVETDNQYIETAGSYTPRGAYIEYGSSSCGSSLMEAAACDDPSVTITVDPRDRPSNGLTNPMLDGRLYRVTGRPGGSVKDTDLWVEQSCEVEPPEEFTVYANCGDPQDQISVDESNRPADAQTFIHNTLSYVRTDAVTTDDPVGGSWSTHPCPGGDLWERCSPNGIFSDELPRRIRVDHARVGADFLRAPVGFARDEGGIGLCRYGVHVAYRLINDDGGDYPEVNPNTVQPLGSCSAFDDRVFWRQCTTGDDIGDPTDPPNFNREGATPPDAMDEVFRRQTARSTCFGCGDGLDGIV